MGKHLVKRERKWIHPSTFSDRRGRLPEYTQWANMLSRTDNAKHKRQPHYVGVTCCEDWLSYDTYMDWAKYQIGYLNVDEKGQLFQLDKDFLKRGNTQYSSDICVFIPRILNNFIRVQSASGELPVGVMLEKKYPNKGVRYVARVKTSDGSNNALYLGIFSCPQKAHEAYVSGKCSVARELAAIWRGKVDPRVIEVLENFRSRLV